MGTIAANVNAIGHIRTAGTETGRFNVGVSLLNTARAWYSTWVEQIELANMPPRLLSDILGETAPHRVESHLRDGFGRSIY